ncbi:MAG: hypothetical protein LBO67_09615 [Spirochaetaceae bacterium]|nr:hypothetical protein [Spirochaetaceae bacterium]
MIFSSAASFQEIPSCTVSFTVYDVIFYPEVQPYAFTGLFPLLFLRITGDMQIITGRFSYQFRIALSAP